MSTQHYSLSLSAKLICRLVLGSLPAVVAVTFSFAQPAESPVPEAANSSFEELPELKASEILKPEFIKGQYHSVREAVPTSSGTNQFTIDSDFGGFEADGNEMLVQRVKEIYAIARLKEVSRTDQFKESLGNAAKGTYKAAKKVVSDPVNAISNVPKGIMKFMGRAKQSIKNVGKKDDSEGTNLEQMIGYANAKRRIAFSMGIDPYSSNTVLQKELDEVAWASWAGGFAFTAGTFPISGPVGAALTVTKVSGSLDKLVNEKPPAELKEINRSGLRSIGVSAQDTNRFLSNTAFTPTQQTAFVLNLKSLSGVANRAAFVRAAGERSSNESDALFCVQTSALMGQLHTGGHPLARIAMIQNFPVCIAEDGTVIAALQWDYAGWTPGAADFLAEVQHLANEPGQNKHVLVAISGQMSPRLQQELQSKGITAKDRFSPGPLK